MKKKRWSKMIGVLLAVFMVAQINAGTLGAVNVYADTAETSEITAEKTDSDSTSDTSAESVDSSSVSTEDETVSGESVESVSSTSETEQSDTYTVMSEASVTAEDSLTTESVTTNGIWIGDDTGTTYATLAEAVSAAEAGAVIHMSGDFDSTQVSGNTINNGITLDIAGDTTITGTDSAAGLIIASGSVLQCSNGATLTMTGFTGTNVNNAAVVIRNGGTWTDGNYVFRDNYYAFYNQGSIDGSSGRDNLVISSDNTGMEKSLSMNQSSTATYKNATITIRMNRNSDQDGQDAGLGGPLVLDNVKLDTQNLRFCLQGSGQNIDGTQYVLYAVDSEIYVSGRWSGSRWGGSYQAFMVESNKGYMSNSKLYVSGSRIGANSELEVTNGSLISVSDSAEGGLTTNWGGSLILSDSTMEGEGLTNPLYGTGSSGTNSIRIEGNSVINTAAADANYDNGGAMDKDSYVVTGGSFLIKYNSNSEAVPTNEAGETLTYFKLADASWDTIDVPASGDNAGYTYTVANASSDGNKYVWVPGAKVTFQLNNDSAYFSDGSTSDKVRYAMRGYKMTDATAVNGEEALASVPDDPTALGYEFAGWYYIDSSGAEQAFDPSAVTIPAEGLTVYAKWNSSENYGAVYHKNLETTDDPTVVVSGNSLDRTMTVLTWDEILAKNADFDETGYQFVSWNTEADGSGTSYAPGDVITLEEGTDKLDLYAQYEPVYVTVTFSANGGTFDDDSVIKQHSDAVMSEDSAVFHITTDDQGGEIAVLNGNFQAGTNLNDYIKSLDSSWRYPYASLNSSFNNSFATREYYTQKGVSWYSFKYYYWYTDADATTQASITSSTVISKDTTYYVGWELNDDIEEIRTDGISLDGDMYSDSTMYSSSETRQLYEGETFALSGSLDVTSIKEKMDSLNSYFGESDSTLSEIALKNCSSDFSAVLTIPEGVDIPDDPEVTLTGLDGLFEIDSVTVDVDARTITVKMALINSYDSYADLYSDVQAVEDTAVVTVNGFTISDEVYSDTSQPDTFTMTGTLTGDFSSFAIKTDAATGESVVKKFDFSWNGVQQDEGRQDGQDASDPTIQYAVQAVRKTTATLDGDILINGDTEHDSVYAATVGDELTYSATYDVSSIKETMDAIEERFGATYWTEDQYRQISLSNTESVFTTVFEVPDALSDVWPTDISSYTLSGTDAFTITDVTKDGNTVTITMTLTGDDNDADDNDVYDNYYELREAIKNDENTSQVLTLTIDPIEIPSTVDTDTNITLVGSASGYMHSDATLNGQTARFSFGWDSTQDTDIPVESDGEITPDGGGDGTDYILTAAEDGTDTSQISATFTASPASSTDDNTSDGEDTTDDTSGTDDNTSDGEETTDDTSGTDDNASDGEETTDDTSDEETTTSSAIAAVSVKTGDNTPIALWIGLICAAGVVFVILIVAYNRRKKKEKEAEE